MIKLTFCLRRRADLTVEEFQTYWRETHAPLVRERARALGVRRYVQCHTMDLAGLHDAFRARNDGAPEPFDGVAELWFDGLDALGGDDEARARAGAELLADERNFIDLARSPMWLGEEHDVVTPYVGSAPVLGCRDVDAMIDHLVHTYGFECPVDSRFGLDDGEGTVYATTSLGANLLHLQIRRREPHPAVRESIESDAYLYVDDVDALHARAVAAGVTVHREPYDEPYGLRDFCAETPEGHRLVFGSER